MLIFITILSFLCAAYSTLNILIFYLPTYLTFRRNHYYEWKPIDLFELIRDILTILIFIGLISLSL